MDRPFFTREQAALIIDAAPEPYKTLFAVAWATGLRAGELLALTTADLDFNRKTVRVSKSSDDNTRDIRQPKTKKSCAMLTMPSALEAMLREYLGHHWKPNPSSFREGHTPSLGRQRREIRSETGSQEIGNTDEEYRASRIPTRPGDGTCRTGRTANSPADADAPRGY